MRTKSVQEVLDLLTTHGNESYFGERVSVLEHSLQTALFAEQAHAPANEIAAALLHDVGHLLHHQGEDVADRGHDTRHEEAGRAYLSQWFGEAVLAPVQMHVAAKRYLCATEPGYFAELSLSSVKSLALQGGPMSPEEAAAFLALPHAESAVRLRRWDDAAKIEALPTPSLDHHLPVLLAASKSNTLP